MDFLSLEHAQENLQFLIEVQAYKEICSECKVSESLGPRRKARQIFEDYISEESEQSINLAGGNRSKIKQGFEKAQQNLFDDAVKEIESMIRKDKYPRFVKSTILLEYIKRFDTQI